ncbi:MAG: bifunctional DNA-formamidopyrimidine glycosylase/DNA-(apurinic or apyrimidinic site) lyase [Deltaproteobacteria bacterium]|nr:bifunctional DNA-formamidopyrimidine glycosylase/DNA-(apurinic or apyrimidinic site) lyase [Deltaproteobacteria bacterium]
MPELPEVETVSRSLRQLIGYTIYNINIREKRLRQKVNSAALKRLCINQQIVNVRRRAKYILIDLTEDVVLLLHLGMSGKLRIFDTDSPLAKHDHIIWQLNGKKDLRFNDARRFGLVDVMYKRDEIKHPNLINLGFEPLSTIFNAKTLFTATRTSNRPIKTWLMDSTCVVGIGNIYASEALFNARIHPLLEAKQLSLSQSRELVRSIKNVLRNAIKQGGTTIRDFISANGEFGYFAKRLQVYGRTGKPCYGCKQAIAKITQTGRSTFFCPHCQQLGR